MEEENLLPSDTLLNSPLPQLPLTPPFSPSSPSYSDFSEEESDEEDIDSPLPTPPHLPQRKWLWRRFETLVLSGAGVRGISTLGAIHYCDTHKMLNIHTYIGTSSGAIICYLLAIGYTPIEIICYLCTHDILNRLDTSNISRAVAGDGFYDFEAFDLELERMTLEKVGYILTLDQLHKKFNKYLIITTYNDTKTKGEYIDYKSHPNLSCITAIRMSCTIPLIFNKFKLLGNYYLDGGFFNNFPIEKAIKGSYTLGIETNAKKTSICKEDSSFFDYVYNILNTLFKSDIDKYEGREDTELVNIKVSNEMFSLKMGTPYVLDAFSMGYRECEKALPSEI